jgi:hypothetical protein
MKRFRVYLFLGSCLFVILGVGIISNIVAKQHCQRDTARWLVDHPLCGEPFYLLDKGDYKQVRGTLDSIGAVYQTTVREREDNSYPRAHLRTKILVPFLVQVDYFWEREAEIGGGGTRTYICFFGSIYFVGEINRFST